MSASPSLIQPHRVPNDSFYVQMSAANECRSKMTIWWHILHNSGRPRLPPLLQFYADVSDAEVIARLKFDRAGKWR